MLSQPTIWLSDHNPEKPLSFWNLKGQDNCGFSSQPFTSTVLRSAIFSHLLCSVHSKHGKGVEGKAMGGRNYDCLITQAQQQGSRSLIWQPSLRVSSLLTNTQVKGFMVGSLFTRVIVLPWCMSWLLLDIGAAANWEAVANASSLFLLKNTFWSFQICTS